MLLSHHRCLGMVSFCPCHLGIVSVYSTLSTRLYIFLREETVRQRCVWFADGLVLPVGLVCKVLSSAIFMKLVFVILHENFQKSASLSLSLTLTLKITLILTLISRTLLKNGTCKKKKKHINAF